MEYSTMKSERDKIVGKMNEVETSRDTYRTRYLEEREVRKCLEEDINRVKKEWRAERNNHTHYATARDPNRYEDMIKSRAEPNTVNNYLNKNESSFERLDQSINSLQKS